MNTATPEAAILAYADRATLIARTLLRLQILPVLTVRTDGREAPVQHPFQTIELSLHRIRIAQYEGGRHTERDNDSRSYGRGHGLVKRRSNSHKGYRIGDESMENVDLERMSACPR